VSGTLPPGNCNVGTTQFACYRGGRCGVCLCPPIPVGCLLKPRVFHSTPSSLAISDCSQQVPFQNSSSMLVSCGPQCSASLLPKSSCSQKTPQRRSKCPNVSVRSCGASPTLTKCASPSANGFGRLQSIPRPKLALTQLCHLKVSRLSWFIL
jgi:hypothetical protein